MRASSRGRSPSRSALVALVAAGLLALVGGGGAGASNLHARVQSSRPAASDLVCAVLHNCPSITGVSPSFGPASTVTITGTNLSKVTSVLFGGTPAQFHYQPSTTQPGRGTILATPPGGPAGSIVPVGGLDGSNPVPSTASFAYPLGRLDVTGPSPTCSLEPASDPDPAWSDDGDDHILALPDAPTTLAFGTATPVFHLSTEFDNDSDSFPFDDQPVLSDPVDPTCHRGFSEVLGTGATFSASLQICEVQPTPAQQATGSCTNWDGHQGQWVTLAPVEESLVDDTQLPAKSTGSDVTGDLALSGPPGSSLNLGQLAETLRVVANVQETDDQTGATLPVSGRSAAATSAPLTAVLSPAAVIQASAIPYTIVYAPPGDQSTATFESKLGFGTDYTLGDSSQQSNSETADEDVKDSLVLALNGKDLNSALSDLGFKLTSDSDWDSSTKDSFGATDDLSAETSDASAITLSRPTSPDYNDWPGDGTTCTELAQPAADHSEFDCSASGLQHLPATSVYNHEAFWDDLFELILHPQFAVYVVGSGQDQYVMLGADPTIGERTARELYDCEQGVEVAGVDQCEVPYSQTGVADANGDEVEYTTSAASSTITPAEARDLLALDPFFEAGSQDAKLAATRAEPIASRSYGAYASGAVAGESGSSEVPNNVMVKFDNTQATKRAAGSTLTSSVEVTDTYGSSTGVGVTFAGSGDTVTVGDKQTSTQTIGMTYKDSTAVSSTIETTGSATLSDIDPATEGAKCPTPSPTAVALCHGALKDESRVSIYLDRLFGSLMFVDPQAPPPPGGLSVATERSLLAGLTFEDLEGEAEQSSGFSDVAPRTAEGLAIGTLTRLGLLSGVGSRFLPNAPFTGGDLVRSLGRSLQLAPSSALRDLTGSRSNPAVPLSESDFAKALSSGFGLSPSVADADLASVTPLRRFAARSVVTRAEAALVLFRVLDSRCLRSCKLAR